MTPPCKFALILIFSTLTGCAFGQKINYAGVSTFTVPEHTPPTVGLAVSDKRPAVVSGEHSLQWVGYSRPPLGIPYGVHTQSGRPLSDDFASLLQSTLAQHNVDVKTVSTQPFEDIPVIVARLAGYQSPKNIIVTLHEWKTDSYVGLSVSLHHSVTLEVVSTRGVQLGRASSAGVREISSTYPLSSAVADIFQALFSTPEITHALSVTPTTP